MWLARWKKASFQSAAYSITTFHITCKVPWEESEGSRIAYLLPIESRLPPFSFLLFPEDALLRVTLRAEGELLRYVESKCADVGTEGTPRMGKGRSKE